MPASAPEFAYVDLAELRFDPENPRFPTSLDGQDTEAVLRFMLQDAGLIDLMRSISKQGFFPGEPLLVAPHQHEAKTWLVIEGNRRLAACTLLVDAGKAPIKKQIVADVAAETDSSRVNPIPCLRFLSREAILVHLGYRHVTGIKEWDPLAKARFLDQQYDLESGSIQTRLRNVARSIGSRSDYVGRLLTAYRLYKILESNNYFDIPDLSETSIDFSLIPSVLAYANIVEYLGLSTSQDLELESLYLGHWNFIARFIFERDGRGATRLGESRNIRQLATALSDSRARTALESGASLAQAQQLLGGSEAAFRGYISAADQNLHLAREEMEGVRFEADDVAVLERVRSTATALRNEVREQIEQAE